MKTKLTLCALFLCISLYSKAQNYVTIPDTNFVNWLNAFYPNCMNGNQMDTTCSDIINAVGLDLTNSTIAMDLTGIKYFTNLQTLVCDGMGLTSLPVLPNLLKILYCGDNELISLPTLPDSMIYLDCNDNNLTSLSAFPSSFRTLICDYNELTNLPNLPNSMVHIECNNNNLTSLPVLPDSLSYFKCEHNQLTIFPSLPDSLKFLDCHANHLTSLTPLPNFLKELYCDQNQLTSLPALPNFLQILWCTYNQLTSLPALSNSLELLACSHNQLTGLPALPNSLEDLRCEYNLLTSLPALPDTMLYIECSVNQLTNLPALPASLHTLACRINQLTSLPVLPNNIFTLDCPQNQLTSLPALPNSLNYLLCHSNHLIDIPDLPNNLHVLSCSNNNISCFPVFPNSLDNLTIYSNPFTCLPNYISIMNAALLTYPLCEQGDTLNNPNGCMGADGITGFTYKDDNTNCLKDAGDNGLINIPLKLYDNNNILLEQMCSHGIGGYKFVKLPGTYKVAIDTTAMAFMIQCPNPGVDTTVTITTANPLTSNINFALACKPGVDLGVQSVVADGLVFPGLQFTLNVFAGSMGQWYNLGCSAGVSGQVVVTVNGSATYTGPAPGALTPTVSGNVYTYNIANFDNVVNAQDFALNFSTSTFSLIGDSICVDVSVTPTIGDINPGNNTYHSCFNVFNSLDPNMKETYPEDVFPGYDDYFTYTIHFQNTGTAPAINIRLVDTLSNNLDPETFQVINYSHSNTTSIVGKVLTVRFPNIMLHDSTNLDPESKGFIQYKIKPKGILPAGTQIKNTAYIYFDYNAPVATNTTINEFMLNVSTQENTASSQMSIYPNPVKDNATLVFSSLKAQHIQISVYDGIGQKMLLLNHRADAGTNSVQINTKALAKGFYLLGVKDESGDVRVVKFVK